MSDTAEVAVADTSVAAPPETAAPAAAPEPAPERAHNRRLIEAAKRERKIQEEANRLKAERESYSRDVESTKAEREALARFKAAQENARRKPLDYVKEAGLTLEDLVKAQLADGDPSIDLLVKDVDSRTQAETRAIREELERFKQEREQERQAAQQAEAQRAAAEIRQDIDKHLSANADKYEYIAALGQESEVFEVMRLAYVERKKILTAEQAADLLEAHLEGLASKVAKTSKLQRFMSPQAPATPAAKPAAPQAKPPTTGARAEASTLTNNIVTSPASPDESEPLESKEAALSRIKAKVAAKLKEQQAAKAKK